MPILIEFANIVIAAPEFATDPTTFKFAKQSAVTLTNIGGGNGAHKLSLKNVINKHNNKYLVFIFIFPLLKL